MSSDDFAQLETGVLLDDAFYRLGPDAVEDTHIGSTNQTAP